MKDKQKSTRIKAFIAAAALSASSVLSGCNLSLVDTKFHFNRALIDGDDSAIVLNVERWKDYAGEQIQIITDDNFVLLTSSFDTFCFTEGNGVFSPSEIANSLNSEVYDLSTGDKKGIYNKSYFDTKWSFNKAIIFNGNRAIILPIKQWRDYDGEQYQVITQYGQTLLLSSFNTKLVYDEKSDMKAYDFAKMYLGSDGIIEDYTEGKLESTNFNFDIIDTKFSFNKVIIFTNNQALVMSINEWKDYEGEQLQLKLGDGITLLTADYDTILVNDENTDFKAYDIAKCLASDVLDISNDSSKGFFNKQILDFNYGFSTGILHNSDSVGSVNVKEWNDYEGEQLQIVLDSGDLILATSMTLKLMNGGNSELNASTISSMMVGEDGKAYDEVKGRTESFTYNKTFVDFNKNAFKYALKINGDNVVILPLKSWKDYENSSETQTYVDSDGNIRTKTVDGAPNCEQLQLMFPDGTVMLTTAYNTVLVNNARDIDVIAEIFRGNNGVITDLTPVLGEPVNSKWNLKILDTKYQFNNAIIATGDNVEIVDVQKWKDFSDGEQVQITFSDGSAMLTSYYNTSLIQSSNNEVVDLIANALVGKNDNIKLKK